MLLNNVVFYIYNANANWERKFNATILCESFIILLIYVEVTVYVVYSELKEYTML